MCAEEMDRTTGQQECPDTCREQPAAPLTTTGQNGTLSFSFTVSAVICLCCEGCHTKHFNHHNYTTLFFVIESNNKNFIVSKGFA